MCACVWGVCVFAFVGVCVCWWVCLQGERGVSVFSVVNFEDTGFSWFLLVIVFHGGRAEEGGT